MNKYKLNKKKHIAREKAKERFINFLIENQRKKIYLKDTDMYIRKFIYHNGWCYFYPGHEGQIAIEEFYKLTRYEIILLMIECFELQEEIKLYELKPYTGYIAFKMMGTKEPYQYNDYDIEQIEKEEIYQMNYIYDYVAEKKLKEDGIKDYRSEL